MVWAFAMAAPLLGAVIAWRIPETFKYSEPEPGERRSWIERKSLAARHGACPRHHGLRGGCGVPRPPPGGARHRPRSRGVRRVRCDRVPGPAPRRLAAGPLRAGALHHRHRHRRDPRASSRSCWPSRFRWRSPAPWRWARRSRCFSRPSLSWSSTACPSRRRGAAMGTFTAFFDVGVGAGSVAGRRGRFDRRLLGGVWLSPPSRRRASSRSRCLCGARRGRSRRRPPDQPSSSGAQNSGSHVAVALVTSAEDDQSRGRRRRPRTGA